jgi:hypothetical protein
MSAQVKDQVKNLLDAAAQKAGFGRRLADGPVRQEIENVAGELSDLFDEFRNGAVAIARREGTTLGATQDQVDTVLRAAGLIDPPQPAARAAGRAAAGNGPTRQEWDNLLAFARRNGYTG